MSAWDYDVRVDITLTCRSEQRFQRLLLPSEMLELSLWNLKLV